MKFLIGITLMLWAIPTLYAGNEGVVKKDIQGMQNALLFYAAQSGNSTLLEQLDRATTDQAITKLYNKTVPKKNKIKHVMTLKVMAEKAVQKFLKDKELFNETEKKTISRKNFQSQRSKKR